jgi:hypothetical protein
VVQSFDVYEGATGIASISPRRGPENQKAKGKLQKAKVISPKGLALLNMLYRLSLCHFIFAICLLPFAF